MNKFNELKQYSNPEYVMNKAQQLGLNPVYPSSQKKHKYMVFDGHKMIHFGLLPYQDYTYHHDEKRRDRFRKRNHRWANAPKYSAAFLSWNLLW